MSDDVDFVNNWKDESTQCKNCKQFVFKEGKNACVPEGKAFEKALEEHGERSPVGHCNYFERK